MDELLGRRLAMTTKAIQATFDARLTASGGSLATWIVLNHASMGPGTRQRDLAASMGIEAPTLVHHLDRLEAACLVERVRDVTDRRVTTVKVTPAGRRLLDRLRRVSEEFDAEMRSLLSPAEQRTLERALTTIRDHFARVDHDERMVDDRRIG